MSLIHKALKKVEKEPEFGKDNFSTSEEAFIRSKSKFSKLSLNPRTIVLIILVVFAGSYAIYSNYTAFCAKKGGAPAPKKSAKTEQKATSPAAVPVVEEKKPSPSVGVTERTTGTVKVELPFEAAKFNSEGKELFMQGDLNGALVKYTEALALASNSSEILNSIGLVYKKRGEPDKAEQYYSEAIKYNPACAECENNLGVLKVDQADTVSAVLHFKKAIELSETYADPYFNLAVIMEKEGNFKSAIDNYKKFLVFTSPDNEDLKLKVRDKIEELALTWDQ